MSDGIDVAPDGSLSCAYCGGPISTGSPPEVKVTEVVGHLDQVGLMREIAHGYWHLVEMDDLMPHVELGRRGRFKVTVEFTPDEP